MVDVQHENTEENTLVDAENLDSAFTPQILKIYHRRARQYGFHTEKMNAMALNGVLQDLTDKQTALDAAREESQQILKMIGVEMNRLFPKEMARYRELEQAVRELTDRVEATNNLALRMHRTAEKRKCARSLLRAVPGLSREPKGERLKETIAKRRQALAAMINRGETPEIFQPE